MLSCRKGTPIFECEPLRPPSEERPPRGGAAFERKPTDIIFVRSRMLYARAALNARGLVNFGLRHIRKCFFACHVTSVLDRPRAHSAKTL